MPKAYKRAKMSLRHRKTMIPKKPHVQKWRLKRYQHELIELNNPTLFLKQYKITLNRFLEMNASQIRKHFKEPICVHDRLVTIVCSSRCQTD